MADENTSNGGKGRSLVHDPPDLGYAGEKKKEGGGPERTPRKKLEKEGGSVWMSW